MAFTNSLWCLYSPIKVVDVFLWFLLELPSAKNFTNMMKTSIILTFALLAVASVPVRAAIVRDDKQYKALCENSGADLRARACFKDSHDALSVIKIPEGEIVDGFVDSSGRSKSFRSHCTEDEDRGGFLT